MQKELANLLIAFIIIIVFLALAENYLYSLYEQNSRIQDNAFPTGSMDKVLHDLRQKNVTRVIGGVNRTFNAYGFSDYEFPKKKESFRILVFGDSFTFGYGNLINETYPKILEKKLNKKGNRRYEVFNLGIEGLNTFIESALFNQTIQELHPDLVIFGFFINDMETLGIPEYESCLDKKNFILQDYIIYSFGYLKYRLSQNDLYFYKLSALNPKGWNCFSESIKRIKTISEVSNIKLLFLDLSMGYDHSFFIPYREKIKNQIESSNLTYQRIPTQNYKNIGFGNTVGHFNVEGNEIVADYLFSYLLNSLNMH